VTRFGKIFAHWAFVYLGKYNKYERSSSILGHFFHGKNKCIIYYKKWDVQQLGRFFFKLFWSRCTGGSKDQSHLWLVTSLESSFKRKKNVFALSEANLSRV
jgi:hypothetical protein